MKKATLFSTLLLLFFILTSGIIADNNKETRKPGAFNELKVFGKFDVVLVQGAEESLVLESEKTALSHVISELDENKLKVRMKTNYFQDPEVKLIITYKQLNNISAVAGAVIDAGTIEGGNVILNANSGSTLKAEVIADSLKAESTQGATLNLAGKVSRLDAVVNTGGQLNGYLLNCNNARIKATMGGYAKVYVKEKLDATINMGGNISYKGSPKEVKHSSTMGGTITEIRE